MRVVGRLDEQRKVDPGAVARGSQIDRMTGELGTIVGKQVLRAPRWRTRRLSTSTTCSPRNCCPSSIASPRA
jgi:hypothetical protein